MIYQCYHRKEQKSKLFKNPLFRKPLYKGFGLEPEVNPEITKNCPELKTWENRVQLVEFAAMLYLWRNPPQDGHNWIGFTSYRQLDKSKVIFNDEKKIERILVNYEIITWCYFEFGISLALQAEQHHPGIMDYISEILKDYDISLFWKRTGDFYADYWIMRIDTFNRFMTWLYPFIKDGIKKMKTHPYLLRQSSSQPEPRSPLGYVLERLFIFWRHHFEIKVYDATRGLRDG